MTSSTCLSVYLLSSRAISALEQLQRLLRGLPDGRKGRLLDDQVEPAERVDPHRPRPLLQVQVARAGKKPVLPDHLLDIRDFDPLAKCPGRNFRLKRRVPEMRPQLPEFSSPPHRIPKLCDSPRRVSGLGQEDLPGASTS